MNPYRQALEGWSEDQWWKGAISDGGSRVCVMGRLCRFTAAESYYTVSFKSTSITIRYPYIDRLNAVASELFPDRVDRAGLASSPGPAAQVNDHPDTTFADVCQILEKTAVCYDEQV